MKIKSLKWGYDGGGFACDVIEGNSILEVVAMDEVGKLLFTMASSNGEGIDLKVCDMPIFDIMINLAVDEIDFMAEFEKARSHAIEEYCGVWGENVPEELISSKYADLCNDF